jgi:hypothetical protein
MAQLLFVRLDGALCSLNLALHPSIPRRLFGKGESEKFLLSLDYGGWHIESFGPGVALAEDPW